jgi:hypothetical protein
VEKVAGHERATFADAGRCGRETYLAARALAGRGPPFPRRAEQRAATSAALQALAWTHVAES